MGFSLQCFMDELMSIVNNDKIDEQQREQQLCDAIKEGYEYAKCCGEIE